MGSYKVTLYSNTGFNAYDIPDNPETLANSGSHMTLSDEMELAQNRYLGWITVPYSFEDVEDTDYVKVGDWYYAVAVYGIQATSDDVTKIILVSDPITSAGGWKRVNGSVQSRIDILSGLTSRCTVKDDTLFRYSEDDPLITPMEPLVLKTKWLMLAVDATGNDLGTLSEPTAQGDYISGTSRQAQDPIFIEARVDLPKQYARKDGESCFDPTTGESVTVPVTHMLNINDNDTIGGSTSPDEWNQTTTTMMRIKTNDENVVQAQSAGTAIYMVNDSANPVDGFTIVHSGLITSGTAQADTAGNVIRGGANAVQDNGIAEGSIIHQWRVPRRFISHIAMRYCFVYPTTNGSTDTSRKYISQNIQAIMVLSKDATIPENEVSELKLKYASVKNNRVLYGEFNKYGLMTCAGNSATFKPEEIMDADESVPGITLFADPRADGKPYYRFTTINGDSDFLRNCIAGSPWEQVPLQFEGKAGNALDRINFDNEQALSKNNNNKAIADFTYGQIRNAMNTVQGAISNLTPNSNGGINPIGAGFTIANSALNATQSATDFGFSQHQYQLQKQSQVSELVQKTEVYAPTVMFPYNADVIRDFYENGVLLYKYELSDNDVRRIDKILTMFGYKQTEVLSNDNFFRRKHFDYVECSAVTVTGLPKWWCDEIMAQLRNGVRVWHEAPNRAAFEDNPIL